MYRERSATNGVTPPSCLTWPLGDIIAITQFEIDSAKTFKAPLKRCLETLITPSGVHHRQNKKSKENLLLQGDWPSQDSVSMLEKGLITLGSSIFLTCIVDSPGHDVGEDLGAHSARLAGSTAGHHFQWSGHDWPPDLKIVLFCAYQNHSGEEFLMSHSLTVSLSHCLRLFSQVTVAESQSVSQKPCSLLLCSLFTSSSF